MLGVLFCDSGKAGLVCRLGGAAGAIIAGIGSLMLDSSLEHKQLYDSCRSCRLPWRRKSLCSILAGATALGPDGSRWVRSSSKLCAGHLTATCHRGVCLCCFTTTDAMQRVAGTLCCCQPDSGGAGGRQGQLNCAAADLAGAEWSRM